MHGLTYPAGRGRLVPAVMVRIGMLLASLLRLFLPGTACQMASNCTTTHFSFTGRDRIDTWFDLILANDSRQLFTKLATAPVSLHHRGGQIQNPLDRVLGAHTASVNVRDEVAIGVSVGSFRTVCHVGRQAFSGCQPRSFADQEDGNFRDQQVANLVENSYPAVTNYKYPAETPASNSCSLTEGRQQPRNLHGNRSYRQLVTDHDLQIVPRGAIGDYLRTRLVIQKTAQVRTQQILVLARGPGADFKQIPIPNEAIAEIPEEIQLRAHGISGGRVRLAQLHLSIRPIRRPAPPGQQACRGLRAYLLKDLGEIALGQVVLGRVTLGQVRLRQVTALRESVFLLRHFRPSSPGTIPIPA